MVVLLAAAMLIACAGGCTVRPSPAIEKPAWQLASDENPKLITLARVRVSPALPVPNHLVQPLSTEFSLVIINRPADWLEVRRRLQLPDRLPEVNLTRGAIVGILARPGENAAGQWPIHLTSARTVRGVAHLTADFTEGMYYPLDTASYLELAHIPGVRTVESVRINSRLFSLRSDGTLH